MPETLLTNDPDAFRRFVRRKGRAAVKSPSGSAGLPDDERVLTQLATQRDLAEADASSSPRRSSGAASGWRACAARLLGIDLVRSGART